MSTTPEKQRTDTPESRDRSADETIVIGRQSARAASGQPMPMRVLLMGLFLVVVGFALVYVLMR